LKKTEQDDEEGEDVRKWVSGSSDDEPEHCDDCEAQCVCLPTTDDVDEECTKYCTGDCKGVDEG